jgi:hypothetical protein
MIQQADLDTCLTALILGVSDNDQVEVIRGTAAERDLADPTVLCIEAGGSGRVHQSDYDHHEVRGPTDSACVQAWERWRIGHARGANETDSAAWERLVAYVAMMDTGPISLPRASSPTLSQVISGMRLTVHRPVEQLREGMQILSAVLVNGFDPFASLPELPGWAAYLKARRVNDAALDAVTSRVQVHVSRSGRRIGGVETEAIGAPGILYAMGCDLAVVYHPRFGHPPVRKITIGSNGDKLDNLLDALNHLEPSWGGPASGTIIGSPRPGTQLALEQVLRLVLTMF